MTNSSRKKQKSEKKLQKNHLHMLTAITKFTILDHNHSYSIENLFIVYIYIKIWHTKT